MTFDLRPSTVDYSMLIATTNEAKVREILPVLAGLPVVIETLSAYPNVPPPEETATTFADNARAKALYYAAATGAATVAEDSGLEIAALGGAPGVESARFGGAAAPTYAERFEVIHRRLKQLGAGRSAARFVCAVALARDGRVVFESRGEILGTLAPVPKGHNGFGYDPIFYYPPCGRTLAELSPQEKIEVSHRGRAFRALREFLVQSMSAE